VAGVSAGQPYPPYAGQPYPPYAGQPYPPYSGQPGYPPSQVSVVNLPPEAAAAVQAAVGQALQAAG
jgi:hypothetical protein